MGRILLRLMHRMRGRSTFQQPMERRCLPVFPFVKVMLFFDVGRIRVMNRISPHISFNNCGFGLSSHSVDCNQPQATFTRASLCDDPTQPEDYRGGGFGADSDGLPESDGDDRSLEDEGSARETLMSDLEPHAQEAASDSALRTQVCICFFFCSASVLLREFFLLLTIVFPTCVAQQLRSSSTEIIPNDAVDPAAAAFEVFRVQYSISSSCFPSSAFIIIIIFFKYFFIAEISFCWNCCSWHVYAVTTRITESSQ